MSKTLTYPSSQAAYSCDPLAVREWIVLPALIFFMMFIGALLSNRWMFPSMSPTAR